MSEKKGFEVDENTDSGFLSGPIDRVPDGLEDEPNVKNDDGKEESELVGLDSGVDLCLTQSLGSLRVGDSTEGATVPRVQVTDTANIPPWAQLLLPDSDGDTQLHVAAVHGCEKSTSTLIKICPIRCWLDLQNDFGQTALHLAVMGGNALVARMLVLAGSSPGVRDLNGNTPIHVAVTTQHVECLKALLAPIEHQRPSKTLVGFINQKNYNGQTGLHLAASSGHLATLKTLVYYGADVNNRDGLAGWTPLHIAVRRGHVRVAQFLMEKCPDLIIRTRDYAQRTARRFVKRSPASQEFLRLFSSQPTLSDTESDTDDEYDSDEAESLFEKLKESFTPQPVVTN